MKVKEPRQILRTSVEYDVRKQRDHSIRSKDEQSPPEGPVHGYGTGPKTDPSRGRLPR